LQVSISMAKTRFRRCAHVRDVGRPMADSSPHSFVLRAAADEAMRAEIERFWDQLA
jgi:hypothetical protein